MEQTMASPGESKKPDLFGGTFRSAWGALLLQRDIYLPLRDAQHPVRQGLKTLLVILLTVALANALGQVFDLLTLPRYDRIEEVVAEIIQRTAFYQETIAPNNALAMVFGFFYNLTWFVIRSAGGYPSRFGAVSSFISVVVFGVFNWITYSFILRLVGRRLGGAAEPGAVYGVMALASAPLLLGIAGLWPGLSVPSALTASWMLATQYQAVRSLYDLPWGRSVLIVVLPYLITALLFIISLVGGVALGVALAPLFM